MDLQQRVRIHLTAADKLFLLRRSDLSVRLYDTHEGRRVAGTFKLEELKQLLMELRAEAARTVGAKKRERLKDLHDRIAAGIAKDLEGTDRALDLSDLVIDPERPALICCTLAFSNAAYFLFLMTANGPHDLAFFVRQGADFGPVTIGGEWWRAMASMFVHFDVLHVFFNLVALLLVGPTIERTVGHLVILVAYVVSGLVSSVSSLAWEPDLVTGGASGAIYGLYGFAAALVIDHPALSRNKALQQLGAHLLPYAAISFVRGFFEDGVSNAAHAGGIVAGLAMGLVYGSHPNRGGEISHRVRQASKLAGGGLVVVLVGALLLPREVVRTGREYSSFVDRTSELIISYNSVVKDVNEGRADAAEIHRVLGEIIPRWDSLRSSLGAIPTSSDVFREYFRDTIRFMRTQSDSWELLVQGIETADREAFSRAEDLREEAKRRLQKDPRWPDPSLELPPVIELAWGPP